MVTLKIIRTAFDNGVDSQRSIGWQFKVIIEGGEVVTDMSHVQASNTVKGIDMEYLGWWHEGHYRYDTWSKEIK